jgi:catechol 2,3-dioxygenase-like lactoylglutathione lyase family enzyme
MTDHPNTKAASNLSTIKGINHVGLSVSDLKASMAFYSDAASLEIESTSRFSNSAAEKASGFSNEPVARAALKAPNGYLELSQYDASLTGPAEEVSVTGPGVTHVCYQSPTTQDVYSRFRSLGATPVSRGNEPVDLGGYGVYYAYSRDADGIMFETEHLDKPHFEGPVWFSHVALVSPDLDRLVDFYENLLGSKPNRRSNKVTGPRFDDVIDFDETYIRAAWFDTSNMILELWQFVNPVTPEPGAPVPFEKIGYNKFAFEVSDIDADYKRLVESGVQFLSEPVQTDESTEVYARDPDGNLFSLIQPAPGSSISIDELKPR